MLTLETVRWPLLAILLGAVLGCRGEESVRQLATADAFGTIVGDGLYVVPSHHWGLTENGRWTFGARGELLVHVAEVPAEALVLEIDAAPDSQGYRPFVFWRGEEWGGERTAFGESFEVTIPRSELSLGTHNLSFRRDYSWDRQNVPGAAADTHIDRLAFRVGAETRVVGSESRERLHFFRELLEQGGTGVGGEMLGGLLFDGVGEIELVAEESGQLEMILCNLGGVGTSISLVGEGIALTRSIERGERVPLAIPLESGATLRMATHGAEGLVMVGGLHLSTTAADPRGRPSIVLITLDTTRRDFVAPYSADAVTPNLLALANRATVFEDALSTSPWTIPSHGSMMTGLWPSQHGAGLLRRDLAPRFETLVERLRKTGYYTAGFAGGALAHHAFGLAQGMHRYRDPDGFETEGSQLTQYVGQVLAETRSRPLFLFANYFDGHARYQAPLRFEEESGVAAAADRVSDRRIWGRLAAGDSSVLADAIRGRDGFGPEVEEYLQRAYRAELAHVDEQLGLLFALLQSEGLWEQTMVVVVADHGELLGERGLFTHGHWLEPELIEIPLMIKWPGQTVGRRIKTAVSQVDLFPTILREAGVVVPRDQRGSFLYEIDEPRTGRRTLYFEEHDSPSVHPLFSEVRVANDLLGAQSGDLRVTTWEEERRCQRRLDRQWHAIECPADAPTNAMISSAVGSSERGAAYGVSQMTEEEKTTLRALGYL